MEPKSLVASRVVPVTGERKTVILPIKRGARGGTSASGILPLYAPQKGFFLENSSRNPYIKKLTRKVVVRYPE